MKNQASVRTCYQFKTLLLLSLFALFVSCTQSPQEKMLQAIVAMEQGDSTVSLAQTDSLMALYARFAVSFPEHERSETFLYKALKFHYHHGLYDLSASESEDFLRLFPESKSRRQVLLNLAMLKGLHQNKAHEALDLFEKAGMTEPTVAEQMALYSVYERHAFLFPADSISPKFLYQAAGGWSNLEDWPRCVSLCDSLVKRYPESPYAPKALFLKGFTAENHMNDIVLAEESYKQLIALYPNDELAEQTKLILSKGYLGKSAEEILKSFGKKQG